MPHDKLAAGLHERLITEAVEAALVRLQAEHRDVGRQKQGVQQFDRTLAEHVKQLVLSALGDLDDEDVDARLALVGSVLAALAAASPAVQIPQDLPTHLAGTEGALLTWIAAEARGVGKMTAPELPRNGLIQPALLLNSAQDINLMHELNLELASADRVDAVVSFLRISGLRLLEAGLRDLCARGALRLVTSTYVGATEARAVRELAEMGARVRVAYEEDGTRLHAKSWIFHRESGLGTAYVGSSNLSRSAMVDGAEWNVRVTEAVTPDVVGRLVQAQGLAGGHRGSSTGLNLVGIGRGGGYRPRSRRSASPMIATKRRPTASRAWRMRWPGASNRRWARTAWCISTRR